ncbi:MAG: monofunctional biosynthetic peptidoglycan transglycosylase [Bacteroidaceae bacterium]|nr:monofunctional biosynthetic peptidoglycan transglycosylase [Bacteroidaceae bacterium]
MFKFLIKIMKWAVILFMALSVVGVLIYRFAPVPFTPLMGLRMVEAIGNGELPECHHRWVPLEEISPYLPVAVMASEDQLFLEHHGFDFHSLRQVVEERQSGKRFRGGSTISQQTAKNLFLWPGGWIRKGLEAWFTILIELTWPKERIMECYLNSIEMGPGIYGAEAVAQQHFGCSARQLSRSDCALIAATLPNPRKMSSQHPSRYVRKRQGQIQKQMKHFNFLK